MVCIHCPLCCMRYFPTFNELKKHLLSYLEGNIKCPFCNYNAAGLHSLILHLDVHNDTVKLSEENNYDNEYGDMGMEGGEELEVDITNNLVDIVYEDCGTLEGCEQDRDVFYSDYEINNPRYTCAMCETEFSSMDALRNHAVETHKISSVLVIDDYLDINSELALHDNIGNKTQEDYVQCVLENGETQSFELMCDQCGKQFDKLPKFEHHTQTHLDSSELPFGRSECRENIDKDPSDEQLINQCKSSEAAKTNLTCEKCGKLYNSLKHLNQHIQEKHENCYKCDQCDAVFSTIRERKCHKIKIHVGRKFACTVCGKKFHYKVGLKNHFKTHLPVRPFPCEYCEKRFIDASELRRHMLKHTGEKPHVCEVCGAMFRERYRLNVHMRRHTGERPYACNKCEASFTSGSSLRLHKLIHVEGKFYQCTYCVKVFRTPVNLYNHMKLHTKPFSCDICGRNFSSRIILRKHKRTHDKDYKCDRCGVEFTALRKLELHQKTCGILEENKQHDISQFTESKEQKLSAIDQSIEKNSLHLS